MARVLVTEKIADKGLDLLRDAGHDVDVQIGLDEAGLASAVAGTHAIIIRSATTLKCLAAQPSNKSPTKLAKYKLMPNIQ